MNNYIKALKDHPNQDIARVAKLTGFSNNQLAHEQRKYVKQFINRDSPLWGVDNSSSVSKFYVK